MVASPPQSSPASLPVEAVLGDLLVALAERTAAVLVAPPGAGKTSLVPLALLDTPWCAGRVLVLEPRRLAARAAAARMAALRGEAVGGLVGHRMRGDTLVSRRTRVEVVTEGVLTRMLQTDAALDGVSAVVFDEFHERSLDADAGLAFTLDAQAHLRPDLRVVVMSATIDGAAVARLLGDAPVVESAGRLHPVETIWLGAPPADRMEAETARAVRRALGETVGDVLVFLPGAAEIGRVATALAELAGAVDVLPLHGSLPPAEQDRVLRPGERRRVILATAIAETSLTIEGVRVVVDAGLARSSRFDAGRGMGGLVTTRVSRASADQRRGRAGRTVPGWCYRLWSAAEHDRLQATAEPEIAVADLAPLALDLARWGDPDGIGLRWLDRPPAAALAAAQGLLAELGATDATGRLTSHGEVLQGLGVHPRLAHCIVAADALGLGALACAVVALLGERDLGGFGGARSADVHDRLDRLYGRGGGPVAERVRRAAADLRRRAAVSGSAAGSPAADAGVVLALAYPDRVAQQRAGGGGRFLLRGGTGAALGPGDPLATEAYLAVADLDVRSGGGDARIRLAAALDVADLERVAAGSITTIDRREWDARSGDVVARRERRLGAIVLSEAPLDGPNPEALLDGVRAEGLGLLRWSEGATAFRRRVQFLRRVLGEPWPDWSDEALLATLDDWLAPALTDARRRSDVQRIDVDSLQKGRMSWGDRRGVDELAPEKIVVPSGSAITIDYDADPPVLAVKLQEVFGWTTTPTIAGGRVPLVLHLLSPARRPVQITTDLAGFWRTGYSAVRAELRGRYPKHPWPDDPLAAPATRFTKRRSPGPG